MTIFDDGKNLARGIKQSGHKGRRAKRQKKKIKKAKKAGDDAEVARMRAKRQKTVQQKNKADKNIRRSGVEVGKRFVKAGTSLATGNPTGAVVEFI